MTPSKILTYGKVYDFGELWDDPRLEGFEFAVVETGIRGARMNYHPKTVDSESGDGVECPSTPVGPLS
jgi:hypothetical protein